MTQDEIIEMARQAGMALENYGGTLLVRHLPSDSLEAFAKLVAAKEREAIKALAEKELLNTAALMSMPPQSSAAWNILQAIKARVEK